MAMINQPRTYEVVRNLAPAFTTMNAYIKTIEKDVDSGYVLKNMFTTLNGSWEVGSQGNSVYAIPGWARNIYLRPWGADDYFDDAGADHHILVRVEDADGKVLKRSIKFATSDGQNSMVRNTGEKRSGWTNLPVYNSFSPERGENGGWEVSVNATMPSETVVCGGLPGNLHVSTFLVFRYQDLTWNDPPPPDPVTKVLVIKGKGTAGEVVIRVEGDYEITARYE